MKYSSADITQAVALLEGTGMCKVLRRLPEAPVGPITPGHGLVKVVVLDTESTGLSPTGDKLIEIGAIARYVDVKTGLFVGGAQVCSWLEDPGFALEPHTVALTGLTDADLKGRQFNKGEIVEFMKDAGLVIAHSAAHDRPFFEARFPDLNHFNWGCSLSQINWIEAGAGSSKLEFLAYKLGTFYEAHRALPDCHALAYVLEHFRLPDGQSPLQQLIAKSLKSSVRIQANGAPFEKKDVLKASGYFWDGEGRVWHRTVDEDAMDAEFDWLRSEIYEGRPARVNVEFLSAAGRFSHSPPEWAVRQEVRSVGAQGERAPEASSRGARYGNAGRR